MKSILALVSTFSLLTVLGCGGGGESSVLNGGGASVLSGVAAIGAPIVSGTVDVVCATGNSLASTNE